MAYRFMLEVPEAERQAAEIAIGTVPDTQILVTRSSFSAGYDTPRAALSIAAQNLRVIETIYQLYGTSSGAQLEASVVLNSGERLSVPDHTPGSMVAAIRADQPWNEHVLPRIGDHVEEERMTPTVAESSSLATAPVRRGVSIDRVNFLAINVMDLRSAERFYTQTFDMAIVGRTRTSEDGKYHLVLEGYDWEDAIKSETEADDTYIRNGDLILALHRAGTGARLDRDVIDRISIQVDAASYNRLKARTLMNSYEFLGESQASFTFRDPFGVPWEISLSGLLPSILRVALEH